VVVDQNIAVLVVILWGVTPALINFVGVVIAGLKFTVRIGRVALRSFCDKDSVSALPRL